MIQDRGVALWYRAGAFALCLFGVVYNLGVFHGHFHGVFLLYYTLQSNLLALGLLGALVYRTAADLRRRGRRGSARYYPRASAVALLGVSLTLLVFWGFIAPVFPYKQYLFGYTNLSVHLVNPLLMIGDYALFSARGKLKTSDALCFLWLPALYFAQAAILGFAGVNYGFPFIAGVNDNPKPKRFPYFFMDYQTLGWRAALYLWDIFLICLGLACLLLAIHSHEKKKLYPAPIQTPAPRDNKNLPVRQ